MEGEQSIGLRGKALVSIRGCNVRSLYWWVQSSTISHRPGRIVAFQQTDFKKKTKKAQFIKLKKRSQLGFLDLHKESLDPSSHLFTIVLLFSIIIISPNGNGRFSIQSPHQLLAWLSPGMPSSIFTFSCYISLCNLFFVIIFANFCFFFDVFHFKFGIFSCWTPVINIDSGM